MNKKLMNAMRRASLHLRSWCGAHSLVVGMTQGCICVAVFRGGRVPCIVAEYEHAVCDDLSGEASTHWLPYVQTLKKILSTHKFQGMPCTVILSEYWVRWAAVPWGAEGASSAEMSAQEFEGVVQLSFAQLHMDTQDWVYVADLPRYGHTQLAAAIPLALLNELHATVDLTGGRLASCLSAHVLAWNYSRNGLSNCQYWRPYARADQAQIFATLDGQTLTLLSNKKSNGSAIRSIHIGVKVESLVPIIEHEIVSQKLQSPQVTVLSLTPLPDNFDMPAYWDLLDINNIQPNKIGEAGGCSPVSVRAAAVLCHLFGVMAGRHTLMGWFWRWWRQNFSFNRNKELNIDFAKQNPQKIWSVRQLSAVSLLIVGLLLMNYAYLKMQLTTLQAQVNLNKSASVVVEKNRPSLMKVDAQKSIESAKAAQIFNSLSLPWDDLLLVLNESAEITDVRFLSIVANSQECRVNVIGEARNFKSILAFVQEFKERMAMLQDTLQIYLIDDQGENGALRPIRFGFNVTM